MTIKSSERSSTSAILIPFLFWYPDTSFAHAQPMQREMTMPRQQRLCRGGIYKVLNLSQFYVHIFVCFNCCFVVIIKYVYELYVSSLNILICCWAMCCQIATVERVFLFDILSLGSDVAFNAGLRAVMQSTRLQKVCNIAVCSLMCMWCAELYCHPPRPQAADGGAASRYRGQLRDKRVSA